MLHLWRNARWQQTFISAYTKVSAMLGGRLLVRQVLYRRQWFANGNSARNCCRSDTMPCSAHTFLLSNCLWCITFSVFYSWFVSSFVSLPFLFFVLFQYLLFSSNFRPFLLNFLSFVSFSVRASFHFFFTSFSISSPCLLILMAILFARFISWRSLQHVWWKVP